MPRAGRDRPEAEADRPATRTRGRARRPRDPWWDNVRWASGTLVVVGHTTESLADLDGLRWLYVASWALRVPVFVMVAGYFSAAGPLTPRDGRRIVESIAVPYLAVGALHSVQMWLYYDEWHAYVVSPAWGLWFLLSLVVWRVALPYLVLLRRPFTLSVLAALLVGYLDDVGYAYSASRTVTFLPFFLLGHRIRTGGPGGPGRMLDARWSRLAAASVLLAVLPVSWLLRHEVRDYWLAMRGPYGYQLPFGTEWAWALRAGVLLVGVVVALSFVRLMPRRRLPVISYLGAGGLYVYLLHPLVVRALHRAMGLEWVGPWYEQLCLVLVAVAVAGLLASPPVRLLARPLIQPRLDWLFEKEARNVDQRQVSVPLTRPSPPPKEAPCSAVGPRSPSPPQPR